MPVYIIVLLPFLFVGWFVCVIFILSRLKWAKLAEFYRHTGDFNGKDLGIISAKVGMINYNNVIRASYSQEGLHFRLMFIFKLFHPPLLIPWNKIISTRERKFLFAKMTELNVEGGNILIKRSTFEKFKESMEKGQNTFSTNRNQIK